MNESRQSITQAPPTRKEELLCFLFFTVVVAPLFTVGLVGALGFTIWIYQLITGPAGG